MNLAPLTPIVVSLGISALMAMGSREHHRVDEGRQIYKFPSVYTYLFFGIILLFAGVPFLPGITGNDPSSMYFFYLLPLAPLLGALYFFRYRLVIEGNSVWVGAFKIYRFATTDIVQSKLKSGRGAELMLLLINGKKIHLSGILTDFDSLAEALRIEPERSA